MRRLFSFAAVTVLLSGPLGSCQAWAQTGNPTALPPGGPNTPATAGTARTTQQPSGAGVTTPPSGTTPTGRARAPRQASPQGFDSGGLNSGANGSGFSDRFAPAQRFGGNAGVFDRGPATGVPSGRTPASALPGRPNFSGGSTSSTLRPGAPLSGGPNAGDQIRTQGNAPFDASRAGNSSAAIAAENNVRGAIISPLAPIVPFVPFVPQPAIGPSGPIAPVVPQAAVARALPVPAGIQASGQTGIETNVRTTGVEPLLEPRGVATATAFPVRDPIAAGDATATSSTRSMVPSARSDFVEIPAGGGGHRTTRYRGDESDLAQRSGAAYVYPGYTLWQGYYWYHTPTGGWNYWDGSRWTRF